MKKLSIFFGSILIVSFLLQIFSSHAQAGNLNSLIVRLDRHAISSSTGGQICATTPSSDNGTENNVQVIFPTGFTLNSTASNWTVTTSNLPTGSTAWTGIGTATGISGQIVTFPSSNLSTSTQYCFNFSGTNTLTTPSTTGNYEVTLRNRNSGNSIIDSATAGLSIISNDRISVSATVAAQPTDYQASLTLTSPSGTTFAQNTTLNYTLTYGTTLTYSSSITVEAEWSLGTIQGAGSPTVDVLNYVTGSASNGYSSSSPVVDLTNRKISWTINSFPGSTSGQTVTFSLKTNASYTGSSPVSFTVSGRVLGPGTTTADSTVTKSYQYNNGVTSTPTPAPTNTPTPGPTATGTPAPTATPNPNLTIDTIEIRSVTSSQAAIFVATNVNSTVTLSYGTSLDSLTSQVLSNSLSTQRLITLSDLNPNTQYYFKISAKNSTGNILSSELYSLHTAILSIPPQVQKNSLILLSGDLILFDAYRDTQLKQTEKNLAKDIQQAQNNYVIIPKNTPYSFKFVVSDYQQVRQVSAILRNNNILGINNVGSVEPNSDSVSIVEIRPGEFIGRLNSKPIPGKYQLVIRITDYYGNITEQKIADIIVTEPLFITRKGTNDPIENVKVTFYYYNQRTRIYELLSPAILPIKNPNFSEPDGHVPTVLPQGKYKAEIEAIGYEKKTIEFTIGPNEGEVYPHIRLKRLPFNFLATLSVYRETSSDIFHSTGFFLKNLITSGRFLEFVAAVTLLSFVLISLLATSSRLSIPFFLLPWFMLYHFSLLFKKLEFHDMYEGKIKNSLIGEVVSNATVHIALKSGKIITHTTTNAFGEFYVRLPSHASYKIIAAKEGYKSTTQNVMSIEFEKGLRLDLNPIEKPINRVFAGVIWYSRFLLASGFEGIMAITVCLEILLGIEFGWLKVAPFIAISLANLFLWASYIRHTRSVQ